MILSLGLIFVRLNSKFVNKYGKHKLSRAKNKMISAEYFNGQIKDISSSSKIVNETMKLPYIHKLSFDPYLKIKYRQDSKDRIKTDTRDKTEKMLNIPPYPSPYIFALFSYKAYENYPQQQANDATYIPSFLRKTPKMKTVIPLPDGWDILSTASNVTSGNGYFGTAFLNADNRQVVIAHRGTDPFNVNSVFTDIKGIYGNNYVSQMNSACTFAHEIQSLVRENYQIFFTGHSLGAWLAQITTFSLKYLKLLDNLFLKNPGVGYHAHTEVFDSPGCRDMLRTMTTDFYARYADKTTFLDSLDITSYLSSPNFINCCNFHVGTLYRIFPNITSDKPLNYVSSSHSISGILKCFDHNTGQPKKDESTNSRKIKLIMDWPKIDVKFWRWLFDSTSNGNNSLLGEEYNTFFHWAQKLNNFDPTTEDTIVSIPKGSSAKYTSIRYQTKPLAENVFPSSVFTAKELEFLQLFNWLRMVPEFFRPEIFFKNINSVSALFIQKRLESLTLRQKFITYEDTFDSRELIPFVKTLLRLHPELLKELRKSLTSSERSDEVRRRVYSNISEQYSQKMAPLVNVFNNIPDEVSKDVEEFLTNENLKLCHFIADDTNLAMARVLNNDIIKSSKSVALELKTILAINNSFEIREWLKDNSTLLILEYDGNFKCNQTKTCFRDLIDFLRESETVKMILLTAKNTGSREVKAYCSVALTDQYRSCSIDGIQWQHLNNKAKRFILDKKLITFQGLREQFSLKKLIGYNDPDLNLNDLDEIFDTETLNKLLKNENLNVGKPISGLDEIFDYYIPRHLKFKTFVNEAFLGTLRETGQDVVCIGGICTENQRRNDRIHVIHSEGQFEQICEKYPDKNVHWLKNESRQPGSLVWEETRGSLSNLRKHFHELPSSTHSEDELVSRLVNKELILISDTAGMGKTILLRSLAQKIKLKFNELWVLSINLNDCSPSLAKLSGKLSSKFFNSDNPNRAVNFFMDKLLPCCFESKLNKLERGLLQNAFNRHGGVVLLLDAFDEISPDYAEIITQLLEAMANTRVRNIIVTTRPHAKEELENRLKTLSYTMVPFTRNNFEEFTLKYLKKYQTTQLSDAELNNYIKYYVENLISSIGYESGEFLGVPLQCTQLAEFMLENIGRKDNPTLIDLYRSFAKKKFKIYHFDKGLNTMGKVSPESKNQIVEANLKKVHQKYALQLILPKNVFEQLNYKDVDPDVRDKVEKEALRAGIIVKMGDRPRFSHRTFAEYFVLEYLLELARNVEKKATGILCKEILIKNRFGVVRSFLESVVKEDGNEKELVQNIWWSFINGLAVEWNEYFNEDGENVMFVMLRENHRTLLEAFCNLLSEKHIPSSLINYIYARNISGSIALHCAAQHGSLQAVRFLAENTGLIWPFRKRKLDTRNQDGETALLIASKLGHRDVAKYLMNHGASLHAKDKNGFSPLHLASYNGYLEIVLALRRKGANVNDVTLQGEVPLHCAAQKGHDDVVLVLIKEGANINAITNKNNIYPGETALHLSARMGHSNVVRALLNHGANVRIRSDRNETPSQVASRNLGFYETMDLKWSSLD